MGSFRVDGQWAPRVTKPCSYPEALEALASLAGSVVGRRRCHVAVGVGLRSPR